jgi:hypothetical protein
MSGTYVSVPVIGTLTAAGGYDQKFRASPSLYCVVQLVGATSGGGASWALFQGGLPVGFSGGNLMESNQLLMAPTDDVEVIITGGTAGTSVIAQLVGTGYQTFQEAIQHYQRSPNPQGIDATISGGAVSITGDVPVSDGGLAGSVAQRLSQISVLATSNLTSGAATTINTGTGTANLYPSNAASWQLVISGLQGSTSSCRVVWTKEDALGNQLGYVQRDTAAAGTLDKIICSGILDAPITIFQITLEAGAPAGCTVTIYTSALMLQDNFFDSGIYENTSAQAGFFSPGYDGILTTVSNTIVASGNQTYALPTYRGPAQLGIEMTQTGHLTIQENTYLGGVVSNKMSIPVSSAGLAQQIFIVFLGGMSNNIITFNDDAGATNTFFLEVRAIKDLLD